MALRRIDSGGDDCRNSDYSASDCRRDAMKLLIAYLLLTAVLTLFFGWEVQMLKAENNSLREELRELETPIIDCSNSEVLHNVMVYTNGEIRLNDHRP